MEQNNDLYHLLVDGLGDEDRSETKRLIRENHADQLRTLRARRDHGEQAAAPGRER